MGRGFAVLLCLFVALAHAAVPKPVAVEDTTLLRWLLRDEVTSGDLPSGQWAVSPVGTENLQLILFRNGTEYKRLPAKVTERFIADYPDLFADTTSARRDDQRLSLQRVSPYWAWVETESFDKLDGPWFQQTEGIDAGRQIIGSRGQRWWIQDQYWIRAAKIFGSFRVSAGLIRSSDYMNIQREMREYYGQSDFSDYSWQLGVTWKAFSYQMQSWSWILPEYYWFEPSVDTLWAASRGGEDSLSKGKVVSQFYHASDSSLGASFSSNMVHKFEARLWHLRYSLLMDADRYTESVHRLGFEDMENSLGTWGAFAVGCGGIWVPGFWFEVGPAFSYHFTQLDGWNTLSWMPLRFEMMYENTSHFRLHFGTRIHWGGN